MGRLRDLFTGGSKPTPARRFGKKRSLGIEAALAAAMGSLYDVGDPSHEGLGDLFQRAPSISAREANSLEVRKTLRDRARYEFSNNCYAKRMVKTDAKTVVGRGPRLQITDPRFSENDRSEYTRVFHAWCKADKFGRKLRQLRMARSVDGEGVGVFDTREDLRHEVKLSLFLVECDRLTDLLDLQDSYNKVDGIIYDDHGTPVEYMILKRHPDELHTLGAEGDWDTFKADQVIHYFTRDRVGQVRGIPDITQATPLFGQLRGYTLATIGAARAVANVKGFLSTDLPADAVSDPAGGGDDDAEVSGIEELDTIELPDGTFLTLPAGMKYMQPKAEQPVTNYGMFKAEILGEAGGALCQPYNVAAGNSKDYNYASGRLDKQEWHTFIDQEREDLIDDIVDVVLYKFHEEAALIKGLLPKAFAQRDLRFDHGWHFDGVPHVDPQKEANAQATRLKSRTTSLRDEMAERGKDWREHLEQLAEEKKAMDELGLTLADVAPAKEEPEEEPDDEKAKKGDDDED